MATSRRVLRSFCTYSASRRAAASTSSRCARSVRLCEAGSLSRSCVSSSQTTSSRSSRWRIRRSTKRSKSTSGSPSPSASQGGAVAIPRSRQKVVLQPVAHARIHAIERSFIEASDDALALFGKEVRPGCRPGRGSAGGGSARRILTLRSAGSTSRSISSAVDAGGCEVEELHDFVGHAGLHDVATGGLHHARGPGRRSCVPTGSDAAAVTASVSAMWSS